MAAPFVFRLPNSEVVLSSKFDFIAPAAPETLKKQLSKQPLCLFVAVRAR
jgi:hypothetical protein